MSISTKLRKFLDGHQIKYHVTQHSTAYTAQEVAQMAHESGKDFAKTVICKIDGQFFMVVLPANHTVDLNDIKVELSANDVQLANEDDFKDLFPDCEIGAMPPFGNLYGLKVIIDKSMADLDLISFNAGNHREIIKMRYVDFIRLINPKPARIIRLVV